MAARKITATARPRKTTLKGHIAQPASGGAAKPNTLVRGK